MNFRFFLLFSGAGVLALASAVQATTYSVRRLPLPTGATYARGLAINDIGQIVGCINTGQIQDPRVTIPLSVEHAALWNTDGEVKDLGMLPGGNRSWARAINNQGQIAGWSSVTSDASLRSKHAVVWDKNGAITDLGTLGSEISEAIAINNAGQVLVASGRPFVWSAKNGMKELPLVAGCKGSSAVSINDQGEIAGTCTDADGKAHAVVWDANGTIKDITDAVTLGGGVATLAHISNAGQVVGTERKHGAKKLAFVWSSRHGLSYVGGNLPDPPEFFGFTNPPPTPGNTASSVNDRGEIVGSYYGKYTLGRAFVWGQEAGMTALPLAPKQEESGSKPGK
jgi:probable HAF family extracellular repeat protein/YD repeat-containing protein